MSPSPWRHWAICCLVACTVSISGSRAANIVAGPGEAGLRAAIAAAQDGDIVTLTNLVELAAPVRLDQRITLRANSADAWGIYILGYFDGEMFQIATNGIVLEWLRLYGSFEMDGLRLESSGQATLRDCTIQAMRRPVVIGSLSTLNNKLVLERVLVTECQQPFDCPVLEARDCTFSEMAGYGAVTAGEAHFERCTFERNTGNGLQLMYGSVKNCVFRYNGGMGLRYDPDPGVLNISGSLFYANAGAGAYLGEQAIITVDNCTFTRHTGSPAIVIDQAERVLLRHCTVTDNLLTELGSPWYPWSAAVSIGFGGPVELQNCLIAGNPTSEEPDAAGISGTWIDGGGNVIGGAAGLRVLRDNGGPTLTMLPFPGSPAINAGVASELVTDARGLSRVAGAAPDAGAVEVNATAVADSDGDGLPDIWESFHSLNSTNSTDAASDTDADGRSALDEFRGRTDPNNSQSFMRIEEFTIVSDFSNPTQKFVLLKWRPVPGVTYRVETSTDLQHWRPASGYTQLDIIQPNISALRFAGVAESSIAFYRLTTAENAAD